jgi:hypothetical protein
MAQPIQGVYRFLLSLPVELAQAARDRADKQGITLTYYLRDLIVKDVNIQSEQSNVSNS